MKKYISVKEYADNEGTTVQNVYKKLNRNKLSYIEKKDETGKVKKYIEIETDETEVNEQIEIKDVSIEETPEEKGNTELDIIKKTLEILEGQLKEKDKQIESLNNQVEKLSTMLDQAQKLQALSMTKQLELEENNGEVESKEERIGYKQPEEEPKGFWKKLGYWFTH